MHIQKDNFVLCLRSTVYCLLSTVYCLLSTVYCLLSTVYCLLSTVYCLLSTVCCLLSTVYCLLSTVCCLLSIVYCLLYTVYYLSELVIFPAVDGNVAAGVEDQEEVGDERKQVTPSNILLVKTPCMVRAYSKTGVIEWELPCHPSFNLLVQFTHSSYNANASMKLFSYNLSTFLYNWVGIIRIIECSSMWNIADNFFLMKLNRC